MGTRDGGIFLIFSFPFLIPFLYPIFLALSLLEKELFNKKGNPKDIKIKKMSERKRIFPELFLSFFIWGNHMLAQEYILGIGIAIKSLSQHEPFLDFIFLIEGFLQRFSCFLMNERRNPKAYKIKIENEIS